MPSRTESRRSQGTQETTNSVVVFDPKAKAADLSAAIEQRRTQIMSFMEATTDEYERFVNIALDAIVRDHNLLQADLLSLVQSIRHAAIMGLEPTSIMGEGAIVVYRDSGQGGKKIAQFQPMVRGLQKLARNSGDVAAIGVDVVRAKDSFHYQSGSDPRIDHEPYIKGFTGDEDPGEVIGAYAYLRLTSGELLPMFMSTAEILKRRRISKSYQNSGEKSIWGQWPEEMMKKTVLRRLLQERAPLSFRARRALALDAAIDSADGTPALEAALSRTAARQIAALDAEEGEVAPESTDRGNGSPRGPTEPTDDPAEEAEVREICGKPGLTEGDVCLVSAGHREPHKAGNGHEWL